LAGTWNDAKTVNWSAFQINNDKSTLIVIALATDESTVMQTATADRLRSSRGLAANKI
jgi:hypothetical protein